MKLSTIWNVIEASAQDAGAAHVGASALADRHASNFSAWIDSGHHASMAYLARNREVRLDPGTRFPWARSAIVILVPYASERPPAPRDAISNHISRYALGDDYHEVIDGMLQTIEQAVHEVAPEVRTWRYVDTGPLSDRALAAQAGLGWIGKNSMLIHEQDGSWFFIGTLLSSMENDLVAAEVADRCGNCVRCIEACPTTAILPGRVVDSGRCISHATIEDRGPIHPDIAARLDGNAFGCDICQEVCPWNAAPPEPHPAFRTREEYRMTPITDLLRYEQPDFSSLFRKSPIKRARLAGMKRNVAAIIGRPVEKR